jgi:hypothetical protein
MLLGSSLQTGQVTVSHSLYCHFNTTHLFSCASIIPDMISECIYQMIVEYRIYQKVKVRKMSCSDKVKLFCEVSMTLLKINNATTHFLQSIFARYRLQILRPDGSTCQVCGFLTFLQQIIK